MKFGENLIKKAKMSQEKLAEKMNVTRQSVSKWDNENTSKDIFKKSAKKICERFKKRVKQVAVKLQFCNLLDL